MNLQPKNLVATHKLRNHVIVELFFKNKNTIQSYSYILYVVTFLASTRLSVASIISSSGTFIVSLLALTSGCYYKQIGASAPFNFVYLISWDLISPAYCWWALWTVLSFTQAPRTPPAFLSRWGCGRATPSVCSASPMALTPSSSSGAEWTRRASPQVWRPPGTASC